MSTHNICIYKEKQTKMIAYASSNTPFMKDFADLTLKCALIVPLLGEYLATSVSSNFEKPKHTAR